MVTGGRFCLGYDKNFPLGSVNWFRGQGRKGRPLENIVVFDGLNRDISDLF
jgi:hypothetical protein